MSSRRRACCGRRGASRLRSETLIYMQSKSEMEEKTCNLFVALSLGRKRAPVKYSTRQQAVGGAAGDGGGGSFRVLGKS